MFVRVLYFAALRDVVQRPEEELELPPAAVTIAEFLDVLVVRHPQLAGQLGAVRVAQNETFADRNAPLSNGDILALIPPVAGG